MSFITINLDLMSLLALILSVVSFWWLLQESKLVTFLKTFPGPKLFPLLGNVLEFRNLSEVLDNYVSYAKKHGHRVRLFRGNLGSLVLFHPNDIEKLLSSPALIAKAESYKFLIPWLGTGLFICKGQEWRERKKLYTPVFFHSKVLETFNSIFNEQAQVLVDVLKGKVQQGENGISMHGMFMKCTLDIICEAAFGKKLNSQREPYHAYADAVAKESEYVFKRLVSPWLQPDLLFKCSSLGRKEAKNRELMQSFVMEVIEERKRLNKDSYLEISDVDFVYRSNTRNFCVLDMFIQQQEEGNEGFKTDDSLRDEVNSIVFAGHDTTASNLIWTLFLIATNPQVQKTVQEELEAVLGKDKEFPISSLDLANLKYLECCLKESLRLYPPASLIGRKLEQDLKLDDGVVLPKGLDVTVSPYATHRLPELYPDPLDFKPSRHFPENCKGRHPYAFLPFSAGVRNCLGMKYAYAENKIILAHIFRNFHVQCLDDPSTVIIDPVIIIRPKGDIRFRFTARE